MVDREKENEKRREWKKVRTDMGTEWWRMSEQEGRWIGQRRDGETTELVEEWNYEG